MARATKPHKVSIDDEAVKEILSALLQEFKQRQLGATELRNGYEGLPPAEMRAICCEGGSISEVDFDLAMKDLIDGKLVGTGPMEPISSPPRSSVLYFFMRSKDEYAYLTEDGYKAASKVRPARPPRVPMPTVHISGGTFHQSPIGVGGQVQQSVSVSAGADDLFGRFRDEIVKHVVDEQKRATALQHLETLESSTDKPAKMDFYNKLVGSVADHMTVFGPLLPMLMQHIMS